MFGQQSYCFLRQTERGFTIVNVLSQKKLFFLPHQLNLLHFLLNETLVFSFWFSQTEQQREEGMIWDEKEKKQHNERKERETNTKSSVGEQRIKEMKQENEKKRLTDRRLTERQAKQEDTKKNKEKDSKPAEITLLLRILPHFRLLHWFFLLLSLSSLFLVPFHFLPQMKERNKNIYDTTRQGFCFHWFTLNFDAFSDSTCVDFLPNHLPQLRDHGDQVL